MWAAIKTFMMAGPHERFAAFLLQTRGVRKVPIRVLAAAVAEADPMGVAEFAVPVPSALLANAPDVRVAARKKSSPSSGSYGSAKSARPRRSGEEPLQVLPAQAADEAVVLGDERARQLLSTSPINGAAVPSASSRHRGRRRGPR